MQLSNIALATILVTLFATGPVTSTSVSEAIAKFKKLETEAAKKQAQPGPKEKQPPTKSKPKESTTAPITKLPKPAAGSYSPSKRPESSKLAPGPAKPTTSQPKSTPSSKTVSTPASKQLPKPAVPSQPVTRSSKFLFPPPGPPTMPPGQFEEQQESQRSTAQVHKVPGASKVAELAGIWGERVVPSSQLPSRTSSTSPPKPTLKPTSSTPSKPSGTPGTPPKVTSIPGDTNFTRFKEAIKQGKYFDAMMIDGIYGILSDPSPSTLKSYGEFLAGFDAPKIIGMIDGWIEVPDKPSAGHESEPAPELLRWSREPPIGGNLDALRELMVEEYDPVHSVMLTGSLFLVYASGDKSKRFLKGLEHEPDITKSMLSFSVSYSRKFSPENFPKLFNVLTEEDRAEILDNEANEMFKSGKPESFDALIAELQRGKALDKDLANFAFNIAFGLACKNNDLLLAQRYYQSTRIFSSTYTKAILDSYNAERPINEVFDWLLKIAGRDDLLDLVEGYRAPSSIRDTLVKAFKVAKYKFRTQTLATESP